MNPSDSDKLFGWILLSERLASSVDRLVCCACPCCACRVVLTKGCFFLSHPPPPSPSPFTLTPPATTHTIPHSHIYAAQSYGLIRDWETKKDAEKRTRYAPVLDFFNSLPENRGWTLLQFNFTVGVRGSISNVDRTEGWN
jgi:hypothetical protein